MAKDIPQALTEAREPKGGSLTVGRIFGRCLETKTPPGGVQRVGHQQKKRERERESVCVCESVKRKERRKETSDIQVSFLFVVLFVLFVF